MIIPSIYKGKTVAVLGLGKSGQTAVRALNDAGATVWAWDDNAADKTDLTDLLQADWTQIDALVMSPGIPHTYPAPHPVATLAKEHDCPIICDVELLIQAQPNAEYIAITGTNGKSTTTALITHILEVAGIEVQMGGNFGIPVMDLDPLAEDSVYVLEMSSYQLERTPSLVCDVALLMNVSPDHLDRHGGMDGYVAAKKNIFNGQNDAQFAVVGVDDDISKSIYDELADSPVKRIAISAKDVVEDGVFVEEGILIDEAFDDEGAQIMDLSGIKTLPGQHNQQNAAAAYAVCLAIGADPEWIVRGIASFPGLVHRQEFVGNVGDVVFVNDSKATNADAASKALGSYENIHWIAGGVAKEGGIQELSGLFDHITKAYFIGEAEETFAQTVDGHLDYERCGDLETATMKAFEDAKANGGMVLLSPACASFDQFASFEKRGDAFKAIVQRLQEGEVA